MDCWEFCMGMGLIDGYDYGGLFVRKYKKRLTVGFRLRDSRNGSRTCLHFQKKLDSLEYTHYEIFSHKTTSSTTNGGGIGGKVQKDPLAVLRININRLTVESKKPERLPNFLTRTNPRIPSAAQRQTGPAPSMHRSRTRTGRSCHQPSPGCS